MGTRSNREPRHPLIGCLMVSMAGMGICSPACAGTKSERVGTDFAFDGTVPGRPGTHSETASAYPLSWGRFFGLATEAALLRRLAPRGGADRRYTSAGPSQ